MVVGLFATMILIKFLSLFLLRYIRYDITFHCFRVFAFVLFFFAGVILIMVPLQSSMAVPFFFVCFGFSSKSFKLLVSAAREILEIGEQKIERKLI